MDSPFFLICLFWMVFLWQVCSGKHIGKIHLGPRLYLISTSYCISFINRRCKRFGAASRGSLANHLQRLVVCPQGNSYVVCVLMIIFYAKHLRKQLFLDLRLVLLSFLQSCVSICYRLTFLHEREADSFLLR